MRRGRRSDAISIYTVTCQVLCLSLPSTDKQTETPSGGQAACPNSCREKEGELEFEQVNPRGSGDRAVSCPGPIPTLSPLLLPLDSTGNLRRGDHILNMVLAMHSWVLPSTHLAARLLTLYPPKAMSRAWRVEGRDPRVGGDGDRVNRQAWDAGYQSLDQNSSTRRPQGTHRNRGGSRSVTCSGRAGPRPLLP